MRITLTTQVEQDYRQVWQGFDEKLFRALKPPLMPLEILRYDGNQTSNQVHVRIGPFRQAWISVITERGERESEFYFVDEGLQLPFPLKMWRHHHRVLQANDGGSHIIDDFTYATSILLLDYLLYPLFYLLFAARRPVYQTYFAKHANGAEQNTPRH